MKNDYTKYGHFSKDAKEFIITNPNTPRPWINYLTNGTYCALVSQTAAGFSFFRDFKTNRILRWNQANVHFDRPGRYIFIKDKDTQKAWSANWQPIRAKYSKFECRHSLGYTKIFQKNHGIENRITYFIPEAESLEVWLVKIKNTTNKKRNLSVFAYCEWMLGDYRHELIRQTIMELYNRVYFDKKKKAIIAYRTAEWEPFAIKEYKHRNFLSWSLPVKSFDCQKDAFVGRYNTEENPQAVFKGKCINSTCCGEDAIGAMQTDIILGPGEEKEFVVVLGRAKEEKYIVPALKKYLKISIAKKVLAKTKTLWDKRLGNMWVQTPDKDFNNLVNIWLKYQLYMTCFWGRDVSFYHEGTYGGRGYRDNCQDAEGILSLNSKIALDKIRTLARLIRRDGTNARGWSDTFGPFSHKAVKDNPMWLTSTVAAYIKETGNMEILKEKMPYLKDKWRDGSTREDIKWKKGAIEDGKGSLFEHLYKQLQFTYHDTGSHGFPLIDHCDWNDGLDAVGIKGKGESVWIAIGLVRSLKLLSEMALLIGKKKEAKELKRKAQNLSCHINKKGWDKEWYIRGFKDDGSPFGTHKDKQARVWLNSQAWAIMADLVPAKRLPLVLKAMDKYLENAHGRDLFWPAYTKYDSSIGRATMFSPGTKENAAIFNHVVAFSLVADCMTGRGDNAYKVLSKVMPNKQRDIELYKAEPYVFSEYLIGSGHPYLCGEGNFHWMTGTAAWMYIVATEWILGIRREYDGLLIDPCLPSSWKKARIIRKFRGTKYIIEIENKKGVSKGVKAIYLDGEKLKSNLIKPKIGRKECKVKVVMD